MSERLLQSWQSFRSLPAWVQVWVGAVLIPANGAAFFLLHYWSAQLAAWAAALVITTNLPIMLRERGMSKLMAMPHLLAWGPLEVVLVLRLFGHAGPSPVHSVEQWYIALLVIINGLSLVFDAMDSSRWLHGDRSVPRRA